MCRNHRGFIDATLAVSKLGAHGLYLNTAFSGPQLEGVMEREEPVALVYDEEFAELLSEAEAEPTPTPSASSPGATARPSTRRSTS